MRKSKGISIFAVLMILFVSIFSIIPSSTVNAASYASSISTSSKYILYNAYSGKCLQPSGLATTNSTAIVQSDYAGNATQQWKFVQAGSGYYYIQNVTSQTVMDISGKSTATGGSDILYTNNGGNNQQFELISYNGYYKIKNRNSGLVLEIANYSTTNGATCTQNTDYSAANQLFSIIEVTSTDTSTSTGTIKQLSQSQIVAAMGAGWNLGNSMEAVINGTPSETAWGNPTVTKALITAVKNAGFNTIRIPVSYINYIGSGSDYTINSAWLSRVKEVVDYAYSQGMYVIINIHGDGYNSVSGGWLLCNGSDQTTIKAKYKKVWQQIATTFKDYDEHLIFESLNEEFDGTYGTPNTTYYSNINAYNQIFVDTVRQTGGNNTSRWLLIPGWNTDITYTVGNYGFSLPTDSYLSSSVPSGQKRIMISVHYYTPWDFCGEESMNITQWGASATDSSKKSTWGQEDTLYSQFYSLYSKFTSQGYPVVIGEFGSIDKSNSTYRAAFAYAVSNASKQYGCVPIVWDNGVNGTYGFGLFNRSTCAVTQQAIITAIMNGLK
ncbi:cellulase family glycosylhydrolase [Anaerosporobacter sp.]|uniref:cellulase family glycosylhydrolase n=1 Tax=Anaerosporobacter sp. TaxID=1872529 RepID=UPI00286EF203|nr:cellulase family glycosylhydrolase [Anaerosporobacter sp.]